MKITAIKQQKKRLDRYSIFIDQKYRFSLSENQLLDSQLRSGDEITDDDLHKLEADSDMGKALDKAYTFISYRPRSILEIRQSLQRKKYDEDTIEAVISRLDEQDLINDAAFAHDWIESRQLLSLRSKKQLVNELRAKGVESDTIEVALANAGIDDEVPTIIELIQKKRLIHRYPEEQKLIQHLAGKGFSFTSIKAALEEINL